MSPLRRAVFYLGSGQGEINLISLCRAKEFTSAVGLGNMANTALFAALRETEMHCLQKLLSRVFSDDKRPPHSLSGVKRVQVIPDVLIISLQLIRRTLGSVGCYTNISGRWKNTQC